MEAATPPGCKSPRHRALCSSTSPDPAAARSRNSSGARRPTAPLQRGGVRPLPGRARAAPRARRGRSESGGGGAGILPSRLRIVFDKERSEVEEPLFPYNASTPAIFSLDSSAFTLLAGERARDLLAAQGAGSWASAVGNQSVNAAYVIRLANPSTLEGGRAFWAGEEDGQRWGVDAAFFQSGSGGGGAEAARCTVMVVPAPEAELVAWPVEERLPTFV